MVEPKWAMSLRKESDTLLHSLKEGSKKDRGQFAALARNFVKLWENTLNQWDGLKAVQCLRAGGDVEKALKFAMDVEKSFPDFQRIKNLHAWCLYDIYFKMTPEKTTRHDEIFKNAGMIVKLSPSGDFSPCERMMEKFKVWISENKLYNTKTLDNWLDTINPESLCNIPVKHPKGKIDASDAEWWYDQKISGLFGKGKWVECIEKCDSALKSISLFSSQNPDGFFFKYRKAQCLMETEKYEEMEDLLISALKSKNIWFLNLLLSQSYLKRKMPNEAYGYAVKASIDYGPPSKLENGWMVFLHFAILLFQLNDMENAKKHLEFCLALRQKREWPIPAEMKDLMRKMKYEFSPETLPDLQAIYRPLRKFWENEYLDFLKKEPGEVNRVISGKNVYVQSRAGKEFFFPISGYYGNSRELVPGFKVWIFHDAEQKVEEGLTAVAFKITPRNAPRKDNSNTPKPRGRFDKNTKGKDGSRTDFKRKPVKKDESFGRNGRVQKKNEKDR